RLAGVVADMIGEIVRTEPVPRPQAGPVTTFRRRTPAESALPAGATLEQLFDHIRMLDAEGYPPAFLRYEDWVLEFSRATMHADALEAAVTIRRAKAGA